MCLQPFFMSPKDIAQNLKKRREDKQNGQKEKKKEECLALRKKLRKLEDARKNGDGANDIRSVTADGAALQGDNPMLSQDVIDMLDIIYE